MSNNWQRWKGIQKCVPFEEKRLLKWSPPFLIQPKYDGVRCRAVPLANGEYLLLSSEENVIYSVPHVNKELKNLRYTDYEFDGELYYHGMSFEEIISITSRTVNLHPNHEAMQFHVFDIVNESPQSSRLASLIGLKNTFIKTHSLKLSPFWMADDLDDIMRIYDRLINLNYEGIIVRHHQAPYERKRSTLVMKFKPKQKDDYEIVGWKEEISITGEPKGRLGALVLRSGDGNIFFAGSGFNDSSRRSLWNIRESLPGKIARIQYQHLTSGKKVPRFPIFVSIINGDKNE
ncbi:MAG: hypothetical protein KJ888_20410 [Gammaproteobacteria bacterium]|uniref:Polydeoxyribonucleotide synthase [ATP] n=1 Tax=viral metagenome TaxID=1070528 RepID=A0A6M3ITW0_9ZZZZ|nr:hypothetical protein [Gammaproteobacteria bacterium]